MTLAVRCGRSSILRQNLDKFFKHNNKCGMGPHVWPLGTYHVKYAPITFKYQHFRLFFSQKRKKFPECKKWCTRSSAAPTQRPSINYICRLGRGEGDSPKDDLVNRPYLIEKTTRDKHSNYNIARKFCIFLCYNSDYISI